jgi:hypothetical protein
MTTGTKKSPRISKDPCAEASLDPLSQQDILAVRNNLYVWLTASVAHLVCVQKATSDQDAVNKVTTLASKDPHCVAPNATDLMYFVQAIRGSGLDEDDALAQRAAFRLVAETLRDTPSLSSARPRDGVTNPWGSGSTHPELAELDGVFVPNA